MSAVKRWALAIVVVGLCLSMLSFRAVAEATPGEGLVVVGPSVLSDDGRLHEVVFSTSSIPDTDVRVRLLLPEGYDAPDSVDRTYPMLLLLHGAGGDSSSWTTRTDLANHDLARDLIVVMPDGGATGFYTDWVDGPQWETFHTRQLIGWVDDNYRTIGSREGRGIAGLSMGGYGAVIYAARNPDLFVATASFSGAVNIADGGVAEAVALEMLGFGDDRRWGPFMSDEVTWRDHNPPDLATNLPPMLVGLWTGNGVPNPVNGDRVNPPVDPLEAGVYVMNTLTHVRFLEQGVPHHYSDYGLGTHEWHYWERSLLEWLPMFRDAVDDPPLLPEAFRYQTAEPSFDAWGWSFAAERDVKEFVYLTDVSARGLTARGSGLLHVTTPPIYEPGAVHLVSVADGGDRDVVSLADATAGSAVAADDTGRLHFTVDLGPSHTDQQYTPAADAAELLPDYWVTRTVTIAPAEESAAAPTDDAVPPNLATPPTSHTGEDGEPVAFDDPSRSALPRTGSSSSLLLVVYTLVVAMAARTAQHVRRS